MIGWAVFLSFPRVNLKQPLPRHHSICSRWLPFVVQVFPIAFEALESRAFVELERLSVDVVLCDEFDLSCFVSFTASCFAQNGEKAPIRLVNRFLKFLPQSCLSRIGMRGLDKVVHSSKEVRAVSRPHQLLGGFRLFFAKVERAAAYSVVELALARTQGNLPLGRNTLFVLIHSLHTVRIVGHYSKLFCQRPIRS